MRPFDEYPGSGRGLIGRVSGATCRHGYGLQFMRRIGQTSCVYCGADFAGSYRTCLTMALDHVVPTSVCRELGIPDEWTDDCANKVLACAACNSFCNRYAPTDNPPKPIDLDAFLALRDRVFAKRKELIEASHQKEHAFFERRPWMDR